MKGIINKKGWLSCQFAILLELRKVIDVTNEDFSKKS